MQRKVVKNPKPKHFIAYDLETTRIRGGESPTPLYLTAYGDNFSVSEPVDGNLGELIFKRLLIPANDGIKFVAWNANSFDVYLVAQALLDYEKELKGEKFILRPYMTRSKQLRGMRLKFEKSGLTFEFWDAMAMTGMYTVKLEKFLENFAPEYPKLDIGIKDGTEFDSANVEHVRYADRDSVGLYHAVMKANRIVKELTNHCLQTTIGNLAIKYFQAMIPENVEVWRPPKEPWLALHGPLKRGGYCWAQRQYKGPIWKYDINQAYPAAMRDCQLPAKSCVHIKREFVPGKCGVYRVYIGRGAESEIPFYYRTIEKSLGYFTAGAYVETWLTNIEIEHLIRDGWLVDILEGYYWESSFTMTNMVDHLERLRATDPDGPQGPLGTMIKYIGCNAYGKTLEQIDGIEYLFANECPEDFAPFMEDDPTMKLVYFRFREVLRREYHQPQIGIFITAHTRMVVRDAALMAPANFLYADTDCVVYDKPVDLPIHKTKYGLWKQETDGELGIIIGKKIYWCEKDDNKKAKGLRTRELSRADYEHWLKDKKIPKQCQAQRQNFVKFMGGTPMFKDQSREGTNTDRLTQAVLIGDRFYPVSQ